MRITLNRILPATVLLLVVSALPVASASAGRLDALQRQFLSPPEDCKLMVRWWWFGPAVTNKEIEREMRLMKAAGIGGFQLDTVYPLTIDDPLNGLRNLPYLSEEHLEAVRFTAATARRLALRMDVTLGSGWPYGGPHIPKELAAGWLHLEKVSVGAEATSVPLPKLNPGERYITAFLASGDEKNFAADTLREMTGAQRGQLRVPAGSGPRVVLMFVSGRTGMMVKRPAVGAEGLVMDHYNRTALERHLSVVGEKLLAAAGPGSVHAVFCDSLEVFTSGWTTDFLDEFQRRRGYNLRPYLPALIADIGEKTAAIRNDYGRTLTELVDDRFLAPFQAWCRRHNVRLRLQAYGVPPATISSYAHVDLPEGEEMDWKGFSTIRWASSGGHHFGRPVISAETWTWAHPPAFRATPLDLKALADQYFLSGINQLIAHGWPYSPEQLGQPGWTFYATLALNERNPWWFVMPDVAAYLQRVSFALRQGEPVNDVMVYLPAHDAYTRFRAGQTFSRFDEYAVALSV
jgi:hypothetical protein